MTIAELPSDGPRRQFRLTLPPAPITAECARRLAELAAGLDENAALPPAQRSAMLRRSEAAIHADILGKAIEAAVTTLLRDSAIRPAVPPTITVRPRAEGEDYAIDLSVEALPEITPPAPDDILLERLLAEPDAAEIDAAVESLRRRHGVWHALDESGAAMADEITCDISASLAPNLLRNPGAQGGAGAAHRLPRHWELLPHGALTAEVTGSGEPGVLDIRYQGRVVPDTRAFLAFDSWDAVRAVPGQPFTLTVELRHIAGDLPGDIVFALTLDEFAGPAPGRALHAHAAHVAPGTAAPALAALMVQAGAQPAVTHIRAALYVGGATHEAVDFTIRVANPCLVSPALPPPTPHPALRAERFAWRLGEEGVLPGVDAGLLGLRPGELRRVSIIAPLRAAALPDELAGRALLVEVRAHALRRLALPPLDAAFATLCGQPDLDALRAALAEDLRGDFAAMTARLLRHALLARLAAADPGATLPSALVDIEYRQLTRNAPEGDAAALRALAEQRMRLRLVLRKLGEGFGLAIAAADLEAALAQEAARFPGQEAEALAFLRANAAAARRVADQLWTRRVIDHALSRARVRDRAVTPAALRAAAAALATGEPGLDDAYA